MSEENTNKTPEEQIEENRPQFIGDLYEVESNTRIDTVATLSFGKMIFGACTDIFMKYSDHKTMYPSFDGYEMGEVDLFGEKPYFTLTAFDKQFRVDITKMPEPYEALKGSPDIRLENRIEDNMIISILGSATTKDTVCEIIPLTIPYAFINAAYGIMAPANETDYKDLHDTILGFCTMLNISCSESTHCHESDIFCYEDGFNIAYKKALRKKILLDIGNHQSAIDHYKNQINEYNKLMTSSKRTIRRCKKSLNKIQTLIRGL